MERSGAGGGPGVFTGLSSLDLTDIWLEGMILNVGKHTSQSLGCMYVSLSFTYLSLSINSEVSCFSLSQQASLSKETTWDLLEIQLNVQYLVSSPKNLMVPFPVLKSIYPGWLWGGWLSKPGDCTQSMKPMGTNSKTHNSVFPIKG